MQRDVAPSLGYCQVRNNSIRVTPGALAQSPFTSRAPTFLFFAILHIVCYSESCWREAQYHLVWIIFLSKLQLLQLSLRNQDLLSDIFLKI